MASKVPSRQQDPNYVSPEECQKRFASFLVADPADIPIPRWQVEFLKERMADYCKNGFKGIPFEEFEKELLEELMES